MRIEFSYVGCGRSLGCQEPEMARKLWARWGIVWKWVDTCGSQGLRSRATCPDPSIMCIGLLTSTVSASRDARYLRCSGTCSLLEIPSKFWLQFAVIFEFLKQNEASWASSPSQSWYFFPSSFQPNRVVAREHPHLSRTLPPVSGPETAPEPFIVRLGWVRDTIRGVRLSEIAGKGSNMPLLLAHARVGKPACLRI